LNKEADRILSHSPLQATVIKITNIISKDIPTQTDTSNPKCENLLWLLF